MSKVSIWSGADNKNAQALAAVYADALAGNNGQGLDTDQFTKSVVQVLRSKGGDFEGITAASARQKLNSMDLYVKPETTGTASGTPTIKRQDIVNNIQALSGLTLDSLAKSSKAELESLEQFMIAQAETIDSLEATLADFEEAGSDESE